VVTIGYTAYGIKSSEQHEDLETLFRSAARIPLKVFFALGLGVYAKYVYSWTTRHKP